MPDTILKPNPEKRTMRNPFIKVLLFNDNKIRFKQIIGINKDKRIILRFSNIQKIINKTKVASEISLIIKLINSIQPLVVLK